MSNGGKISPSESFDYGSIKGLSIKGNNSPSIEKRSPSYKQEVSVKSKLSKNSRKMKTAKNITNSIILSSFKDRGKKEARKQNLV